MRQPLLLLLATLLTAQAKPDGFYHQEAEYHSSAASYKNNELQHQNQDDSFYAEHGDLGRKTKPKVNSYSQHTEYVNPKLRNQNGEYGQQTENFDTSAFSNLNHAGSAYGQSNYDAYNRDQSAYGSYRNSDRSSTSYSAANLEDITRQLQQDLSRQLQNAISSQYQHSSSYSHSSSSSHAQMQQDIQDLEQELKANLTRRLQEALHRQYGQQRTQGLNSYSFTNGAMNSNANYNSQELNDLKHQVESNLLQQLQQGVRAQYETSHSGSYSSVRAHSNSPDYPTHNRHLNTDVAPLSADSQIRPGYQTSRDNQYYPVRQPDQTQHSSSNSYSSSYQQTITDVVANVQNDLSQQINEILDEEEEKNRRLIKQGVKPDYDETFEYLRETLKRNITRQLQDELRRKYGSQVERDSHSYSVSGSSTRPNYNTQDLQNLKQQIEDNLVEKLSYGIRQQKSRYDEQKSHFVSLHRQNTDDRRPYQSIYPTLPSTDDRRPYQSNYPTTSSYNYPTRRYDYPDSYQTDRPQPVIPLNGDSHTSAGSYRYHSRQQQTSGYETNPNSQVELHNIQQQLQDQLSRQLQMAIREQKRQYEYSSSESRPSYYTTLQELTDELKQNLTERLHRTLTQHYGTQRTQGSQSFSVSSGGSVSSSANYNTEQLNDITRELQDNLVRQLQEGLRQSFNREQSSSTGVKGGHSGYTAGVKGGHSSYNSYGASSGYAASSQMQRYNQYAGASYGQGQVQSDMQSAADEDCMQRDDPHTRTARDVRRADIDVGDQKQMTSQEAEDLEGLTQKTEDDFLGQQQSEWENTDDLTQKVEDEFAAPNYGFGALHRADNQYANSYQRRESFSQRSEDVQSQTQRIRSYTNPIYRPYYGWNPIIPTQPQNTPRYINPYRPYTPPDRDLTQSTENYFGGLRTDSQLYHRTEQFNSTNHTRQQHDLTQKTEDISKDFVQHTDVDDNKRVGSTIPVYSIHTQKKNDYSDSRSSEELVQHSVDNKYPSSYSHHKQDSDESGSNESSEKKFGNQDERGHLYYPLNVPRQQKKNSDESGSSDSSDESGQRTANRLDRNRLYSYPIRRQPKQNSDESNSNESSDDLRQRTVVDNTYGQNRPSAYSLQRQQKQNSGESNSSEELVQRTVDNKYEPKPLSGYSLQRQQKQNSDESNSSDELVQRTVDNKYEANRLSGYSLQRQQNSDESSENLAQRTIDNKIDKHGLHTYSLHKQDSQESVKNESEDMVQRTVDAKQDQDSNYYSQQYGLSTRQDSLSQRQEIPPFRYDLLAESQNKSRHLQGSSSDLVQRTENGQNYHSARSATYNEAHESQQKYSSVSQVSANTPYQYAPSYVSPTHAENLETADDLVQKPIKPERAYEVQDLTQQAEVRQLPPLYASEDFNKPFETSTIDLETESVPQPGFWKRIGNKFESAYTSVKNAAKSLKDKIVG